MDHIVIDKKTPALNTDKLDTEIFMKLCAISSYSVTTATPEL